MGGQACILYGGAEFSRDLDLCIAIDSDNIEIIKKALDMLKAETVFVPDFQTDALKHGHACHFRCKAQDVDGLRIDMMTKMRGCPDFEELWNRRAIIKLPEIGDIGVLSLPDLVQTKKTQRDKDWPMIRRLIETDINSKFPNADKKRICFWFQECRTPNLLKQISQQYPDIWKDMIQTRLLLKYTLDNDIKKMEVALNKEEMNEKQIDYEYWKPLKKELEKWRHT